MGWLITSATTKECMHVKMVNDGKHAEPLVQSEPKFCFSSLAAAVACYLLIPQQWLYDATLAPGLPLPAAGFSFPQLALMQVWWTNLTQAVQGLFQLSSKPSYVIHSSSCVLVAACASCWSGAARPKWHV